MELKVEMVKSAVETILVRDGVVKSAKQVSEQASQTFDQELKPWFARKALREELNMRYKKLTQLTSGTNSDLNRILR